MKIKALLLTFVIVFSLLPLNIGAYMKTKPSFADSASDFLSMLEITDKNRDAQLPLTRAEFTHLVVNAIGIEISAESDGYFSDVPSNHAYANSIYKAKFLGVISGGGGSRFYPDDVIYFNEAVKIMVCALGYMGMAEVHGGYPLGYLYVAKDIGLLRHIVATDTALTYSNALILLYNFLNADLCEVSGVVGNDSLYGRKYGCSILTEYYGFKTKSGIAKVAGHVSMEPGFYSEGSAFSIDGMVFKTELENLEEYLGLSVVGYYDADNRLRAVWREHKNILYEITADEFISYNDFKISYALENDDKNSLLSVERGFSFVKNGKASAFSEEELKIENGTLKLVDNDGNGAIDCVIVWEKTYMVVSGISNMHDSVYDIHAGKTITLKKEDGYYYTLTDANGTEIMPEDLTGDMVLTLYESVDGKYVKAIVSSEIIKGTITEVNSDDTVEIDDKVYKLNSYFNAEYTVSAGKTGEFLLAHDNTVTAISAKNPQLRYGYLISYFEDSKGLSRNSQLLLLDQSGKYYEYTLAEKLRFNGHPKKYSDDVVRGALSNQGYPRYQLLKYKLNDDGKISVIVTATSFESSASLTDKYTSNAEEESLKIFVNNKKSYFYRTYNIFSPFATVGGHTIIFKVPKKIADSENTDPTADNRLAYYDKKYFTVESTSSLKSYGGYLVNIYDQNASMQPGAVIVYDDSGETINRESAVAHLVEKVTDAVNEDMEQGKKLTVWGKGEYKSYFLSKELCDTLGSDNIPRAGDIITMAIDSRGEVKNLEIDVKYTASALKINNPSSRERYYHTGRVFSTDDGTLLLKIESGPTYSNNDNPEDGIAAFSTGVGQTTYYVQFDKSSSQVKEIKQSDLKTMLASGGEASYVAIYSYYTGATLVVEYVD